MKKILFLTTWFPSNQQPNNGIFIAEHANSILENKQQIQVVYIQLVRTKSLRIKVVVEEQFYQNIPVLNIKLCSALHDLLYNLNFLFNAIVIKSIKKHIKFNEFDLIHSNIVYPAGILAQKLSEQYNIPYYISEHWSGIRKMVKNPLFSNKIRSVYLNAAKIFPVSKYLSNEITDLFKEKLSIKIIPNIINNNIFYFREKPLNESTKLLAVGGWSRKKSKIIKYPELIFEALVDLKSKGIENFELNIIGEGNLIPHLKKYAKEHSLNVNFLGTRDKKFISQLLCESDYFLHPSTIETFSVVIAEALKTGTPVIASNVGAIPELINESNGFLAENTVDSWSRNIERATLSTFDNMQIAKVYSEKFNSLEVGAMIVDAYKS